MFVLLFDQDDTSGDYCQVLLALLAERERPQPTAEEIAAAQEPQEIEEVEEVVLEVRIK